MRILCRGFEREDRSQRLLVRCILVRDLGDQSDAFRMSLRSGLTDLRSSDPQSPPLRRMKETLWAPEDIYPEGKRIETESLTDNLYDEQIDEVARKLKGERYLYLRGSNRVDEIFCRKEKGNMNWATWPSNSTELVPNTWRVPLTAERHFRALTNMFRIILATNLISRLWWMTW